MSLDDVDLMILKMKESNKKLREMLEKINESVEKVKNKLVKKEIVISKITLEQILIRELKK